MNRLAVAFLGILLAGPAVANGQQSTSQDVPKQAPGANNPDMQQQKKTAPKTGQKKATGTASQNAQDVPHQQPDTKSPDLKQQRQPATGATTSTGSSTSKQHRKRGQSKPTSTQTGR